MKKIKISASFSVIFWSWLLLSWSTNWTSKLPPKNARCRSAHSRDSAAVSQICTAQSLFPNCHKVYCSTRCIEPAGNDGKAVETQHQELTATDGLYGWGVREEDALPELVSDEEGVWVDEEEDITEHGKGHSRVEGCLSEMEGCQRSKGWSIRRRTRALAQNALAW